MWLAEMRRKWFKLEGAIRQLQAISQLFGQHKRIDEE
jgi:hypothetical protein